jgi:hypothetical protein
VSIYEFRFPAVNLGGLPDPDPFERGRPCPVCAGCDTFFYHPPAGEAPSVLICVDCITGSFDTAAPPEARPPRRPFTVPPPMPSLEGRLIGHLPGGNPIYEFRGQILPDPRPGNHGAGSLGPAARRGRRQGRRGR